jgi:alpha-L-fucosidase
MTVKYRADSPYSATPTYSYYLDTLQPKTIPYFKDDVLHTVTQIHEYRPDLLAFDLYQNSNLWWVFQARNPNAIEDPVWDFRTGLKIYLPKKSTIETSLGI